MRPARTTVTTVLASACAAVAGCGSVPHAKTSQPRAAARADGGIPPSLLAGERPIGRGPRFQPPVRAAVQSACTATLGNRREAHIEIFGANRVVLLAAGIGTRPPRRFNDGRLMHAKCFGSVVTLDPTGIVYFRPGSRLTVGDLFTAWGQVLSSMRIASFSGRVRAYVDGRPWEGSTRAVPLKTDAEIVLEVGPRVPPHVRFVFPGRPWTGLR